MKLEVEGMSCDGCEEEVEKAVAGVEGVESVRANHEAGVVSVEGDVDGENVKKAVEGAGYEVEA